MPKKVDFHDLSFAHQIGAYVRTGWMPNRSIDERFYEDSRKQVTFCPESGGCCQQEAPNEPRGNLFGGVQKETSAQNSLFATIEDMKKEQNQNSASPWKALPLSDRPKMTEAFAIDCDQHWPLSAPGTIVGLMTRVPGRGYQK